MHLAGIGAERGIRFLGTFGMLNAHLLFNLAFVGTERVDR